MVVNVGASSWEMSASISITIGPLGPAAAGSSTGTRSFSTGGPGSAIDSASPPFGGDAISAGASSSSRSGSGEPTSSSSSSEEITRDAAFLPRPRPRPPRVRPRVPPREPRPRPRPFVFVPPPSSESILRFAWVGYFSTFFLPPSLPPPPTICFRLLAYSVLEMRILTVNSSNFTPARSRLTNDTKLTVIL